MKHFFQIFLICLIIIEVFFFFGGGLLFDLSRHYYGAGGKLFGAVTTKEISEGLQKQYGIDVPKQKLVLEDPIKAFGSYQVKAKLGFEVSGTVYVSVFEEK